MRDQKATASVEISRASLAKQLQCDFRATLRKFRIISMVGNLYSENYQNWHASQDEAEAFGDHIFEVAQSLERIEEQIDELFPESAEAIDRPGVVLKAA